MSAETIVLQSDDDFSSLVAEKGRVLVVFANDSCDLEVDLCELGKRVKDLKMVQADPSKLKDSASKHDIEDHELPTFIFFEDGEVMDKLATGLSYQQLNGGGVTNARLREQIRSIFKI